VKKKFGDAMDVIDAVENIKAQISFMKYACTEMVASRDIVIDDEIVAGMYTIFGSMRDQADEVSEALQGKMRSDNEKKLPNHPSDEEKVGAETDGVGTTHGRPDFHFGERIRPLN
jgi:hypothetical protein